MLLRLFVDGDHFPEDFRLETHPSLRDREKALRDALMPILRGPHLWPSGTVLSRHWAPGTYSTADPGRTAGESGGPRTILASKAGRFKQVKPQHIPTRTKRTPSHLASSSEKRHQRLKSSPMSPSEVATEPAATVHLATQAVRLEQDVTNACNDEESEDDDGWVVVFEEGTVLLRADDTEKITEFIRVTFELMGQVVLRNIMKAWIKILEPGKQTTHQYNGGKTPSGDPENPGRYTAPPWWCDQDDWMIGRGCRHKEPDHVLKKGTPHSDPSVFPP